jgi:hypothetical protein
VKIQTRLTTMAAFILLAGAGRAAYAGLPDAAVREAVEAGMKAAGREVLTESEEALVQRAGRLVTKYGQETVVQALRKAGPAAVEMLEKAGPNTDAVLQLLLRRGDEVLAVTKKLGPAGIDALATAGKQSETALNLLARDGEDALWITAKSERLALVARYGEDAEAALLRQRELAQPLIEQFQGPGAQAVKDLSGQNARRLVEMLDAGELKQIGRSDQLLGAIGKYGNRGMDFVWRNKGALAVAAGLTAFLANPEPFIDGTKDLAQVVGQSVVEPLAQVPAKAAEGLAHNANGTVVICFVATLLAAVYLLRRRWALRRAT